MQGTTKAIAVERIECAPIGWFITNVCGGHILAKVLAANNEEISVDTGEDEIRCDCGKDDCEWNKNLVVDHD